MGGSGSGRWGSRRRKVEQALVLDIAQLQRRGLFRAALMQVGWPSGARITITRSPVGLKLLYKTRSGEGDWQNVKELVPLVTTPTQFGGQRQWFACVCGARCRILYGGILHGSGRFRCRQCHSLRYSSTAETVADRASRGMFKIVKRLDPQESFNELPAKPKRMHWRTYQRLVERYERYDQLWAREAIRRFGFGR